eukprot:365240-Chlamydomonas_euryale.AAC.7
MLPLRVLAVSALLAPRAASAQNTSMLPASIRQSASAVVRHGPVPPNCGARHAGGAGFRFRV